MTQENIDKLEKYRHLYEIWNGTQSVTLDGNAKNDILAVIKAEFNPKYSIDMWCGKCVKDMLVYAFQEMERRRALPDMPINVIEKPKNKKHDKN